MQALKYICVLCLVGIAAYWLLPDRSPSRTTSAETVPDVVYLCKETNQLIKAPPQQVPATNPDTGRATLYRALYCAECETWKVVPPPDVFPGNPLTYPCPKHRRQMTATGPIESAK